MNKEDEKKANEILHSIYNKNGNGAGRIRGYIGDEVIEVALEMATWKEQQMIEKVVKWLSDNHIHYPNNGIGTEQIIKDFKKAMEGE